MLFLDFSSTKDAPIKLQLKALSALLLTDSHPVIKVPGAHMPMFIPSMEILAMGHKPVWLDQLFFVSTPLIADHWQLALHAMRLLDLFVEVPKCLCKGFDLGINSLVLSYSYSPRNHYQTPEARNFIVSKYSSEMALGRALPGFNPKLAEDLFGPF